MSLQDIMNKLSPEERKQIEALAAAASKGGRGFVHVGFSPVYTRTWVDGKQRIQATNLDNTNNCRISYNRQIGRRRISIGINRQKDGTYTINALGAPGSGITWLKDGRMAVILGDTFNDDEKKFINEWAKQKYTTPPDVTTSKTTAPATTTTTDESTDEATADETSTETTTPSTPASAPSGKVNPTQVLKDAQEMVKAGLYPDIKSAVTAHTKGEW